MIFKDKKDWPNKYDINKLITRKNDIQKILNGHKSTIRRNDRYADIGDEITFDDHTFIISNIYQQQLKTITEDDAKFEGYTSLDEYKEALTSIHQGAVWDPEVIVWTHELKKK